MVDGRLLVMGTVCSPPCCGAGPGPALAMVGDRSLAATEASPARRSVAWSSRDGRRWQRQPVRVSGPDGVRARIPSLVAVDPAPGGSCPAVPEYGPAAILTSADGRTWTDLASFPDGYTPWGDTDPRTAVASGVLLTGQDGVGAGIWWLESDGSAWARAVSSVEETAVYGLATDGATVIASGVVRGELQLQPVVRLDGGVHRWWGHVGPEPSRLGGRDRLGGVGGVAIQAGVAVMVGCTDGRAGLWRAELP